MHALVQQWLYMPIASYDSKRAMVTTQYFRIFRKLALQRFCRSAFLLDLARIVR
jgi:hypothetical protein